MNPISRILRTTAIAAALATALTGTADAASVVKNAPKKLSLKKATKQTQRLSRTKSYPAFPKLRVKLDVELHGDAHDEQSGAGALMGSGEASRMFGNAYGYAYKRDRILAEIINFNHRNVPRWGGTYTTPALYEVQHGAALPGCNLPSAVWNGTYCPTPSPRIGWSMTYTSNVWTQHGDMEWATLIAHEFGHAAQNQLGISGGYFGTVQTREAFADCMAGGFLRWAAYYGLLDNVGRGDGYEFQDFFRGLASQTTEENTHGTFDWRYANGVWGWNNGFDGCVNWARTADGV